MGASRWDMENFNKGKVWNIRIRLIATGFHHYLNFSKLAHDAFCKQTLHMYISAAKTSIYLRYTLQYDRESSSVPHIDILQHIMSWTSSTPAYCERELIMQNANEAEYQQNLIVAGNKAHYLQIIVFSTKQWTSKRN